ncbi:MAG: serine hydrolase domain-containing protein, partial [Gemmatimonadota bacterium]
MPNSRRSPASVLFLAVAAILPAACAQADAPPDEAAALADAHPQDTLTTRVTTMIAALDARLDELEAEGMAGVVALWIAGEPVYERGLGHADCALTTPMTPEHVFLIGSITKEFMKVLGYALQADGALSFDDLVGAHLPGLPEHLAGLTVRQLLLHTAGLPDIIDRDGQPIDYTVDYDYEDV